MFLMFALNRLDVLPVDDLGIAQSDPTTLRIAKSACADQTSENRANLASL